MTYNPSSRNGAQNAVHWVLQNAGEPLLVSEIAHRLAIDGAAYHQWDANKERDRIQVTLRLLRKKGLAVSSTRPGDRRLQWTVTPPGELLTAATEHSAPSANPSRLSDRDWALIRSSLPPHSRYADAEVHSRNFVAAVIGDLGLPHSTGLTPSQIKRFWSWIDFGVWRSIVARIPHKLSAEDVEAQSAKLALVSPDRRHD